MIAYLQQDQMISVPIRASNTQERLVYIFHYSSSVWSKPQQYSKQI